VRPGGQRPQGLPGELDPGGDGRPPAPEESGDVGGGFALLDEFDGAEAAALKFFGGADGSRPMGTSQKADRFS
jgi:hypothetical protein